MKVVGIIPARYGAIRLPGKPLIDLLGKTMIRRVWERASQASTLDRVVVATEDKRIVREVESWGGEAVLTSKSCKSGTDRVAEAARRTGGDIIINIQGDEPLIPPAMIDEAVRPLLRDKHLVMATLRTRLCERSDWDKPQVVKVAVDRAGYALYFSRSLLPFPRNTTRDLVVYKHIGLYAFRSDFLKVYSRLQPTPLERAEGLEQLRVLEHGYRILVPETRLDSIAVDTPADAARVRAILKKGKK